MKPVRQLARSVLSVGLLAVVIGCTAAPSVAPTAALPKPTAAPAQPTAAPGAQPTAVPPRPTAAPSPAAASKPTEAPSPAAQPTSKPAAKPTTIEELATYAGPDRQQILEEGARREGKLTWYTSVAADNSRPLAEKFTARYPFIKVETIRVDGSDAVRRIVEEARANRHLVDNIGGTYPAISSLHNEGMLLSYRSPEAAGIPTQLVAEDGTWVADREVPLGFAVNTNLVPGWQSIKTYEDLLKPELKGKLAMTDTTQSIQWTGGVAQVKGEGYLRQLGQQDVTVYSQSGTAILQLVASGETPSLVGISLWPTLRLILDGAPITWIPLEPTPTNTGYAAIARRAPNPHAALLFADFLISKDGQEQYKANSSGPVRQGVEPDLGPITPFQRFYGDATLPPKEYAATYEKWSALHAQLFQRRGP